MYRPYREPRGPRAKGRARAPIPAAIDLAQRLAAIIAGATQLIFTSGHLFAAPAVPLHNRSATDPATHDAWFHARIREALDNPAPPIPHADVEGHFARRQATLRPSNNRVKPAP